MPYLYFTPESYPNKCVGIYDHESSPDYCLFRRGEPLSQLTKEIVIDFICTLSELSRFDFLSNTSSTLLVSARVRTLLEEHFPDDVQFLEVLVKYKGGETRDYTLVNLIQKVPVIDYASSVYNYILDTKAISGFKHLVLFPDGLGKHGLARDVRYSGHIFFSEKLRRVFERNWIKGVRFMTADEFNDIGP